MCIRDRAMLPVERSIHNWVLGALAVWAAAGMVKAAHKAAPGQWNEGEEAHGS